MAKASIVAARQAQAAESMANMLAEALVRLDRIEQIIAGVMAPITPEPETKPTATRPAKGGK